MAYNHNKYAKFQTNDMVTIKDHSGEFKIASSYLDETNDVYLYKLENSDGWVNGWYPQTILSRVE